MTGSLARVSHRPPLTGSAFVRRLAALNDTQAPASRDPFAQRLSQWFDWTHAISLSAALEGAPEAGEGAFVSISAGEREFARVRSLLVKRIAEIGAAKAEAAARPGRALPSRSLPADVAAASTAAAAALEAEADFATHRGRYVACQQTMEANLAPLRKRLRATLAGVSPAMARLAAVDAVMEDVIGEQELVQLASVPAQLEQRFDRLGAEQAPAGPWLAAFRQDMRDLLLAELDLRLQPVEGLLEALRRSSGDRS